MLTSQIRRLLAVLLSPALALAQTTPPAADNTIHVTTRLVYVDVVVHDSSGHLVHGLTQNDFKVIEDGKPQQIDYFVAHSYDIATAPPAPPLQRSKTEFANVPASGPTGSVNMILFDLVNTAPEDQQYARKQMLEFLKALPPGQQVALFVLSDQLHMFQSFTGSSDLLVAAGKLINPKNMRLYQSDAEQQRDIDNLGRMEDALGGRDPGSSIQALANQLTAENVQTAEIRQRITLMAFAEMASAASGYPGRKNLYWLSGSFPFSIATQGQYNITAPVQFSTLNLPNTPISDLNAVNNTAQLVANSQIAVYPISALGLDAGGVGVEVSGTSTASLSGTAGQTTYGYGTDSVKHTLGDTQSQQFNSRSALRAAMNDIAHETGGEAVFGSNDLAGALRRTIEDGSNYYTLAYRPQNHDWDSKYRKIRMELSRSGYSLSYRRGYFAFPAQITNADTAQALNAALQPGAPESTLLLLKGKVELPDAQQPDLHVETTVDASGVDFSTDAAGHRHAKLLVLLVALSDSAVQTDNPPQSSGVIRLDLDPATYASALKDGIRFQQKLALKPGRYRMRLGVSDMNNNRLGTLDIPVEIGPQSAGGR
ncbi:MAG TPA: VWA domain-containing protein [Silvibacterium sp.]|nr:VWA domain-containing protein [Silvibacterium sp.]